ncbi:MAG: outer membrane lipoprotein carrier protein LolA [Bacteroidales bacterium]|nr:outer membrane lipoprotein carrier protein LolA [Bacteroidales bacterium]MCF8454771.1 outer membrane lipoprotein carrier protein LolA [Bacteroidales bacterium]
MKKRIIFIAIILSTSVLLAQSDMKDPKAKEILDNLSKETKSYSTIYADFSFTMENQQEDITETYDGKVWIKGDKYHLTLMGTETYCDGKTIWTHMIESDEVNISNRNLEDKSFLSNPRSIFSMYEEGYKYTLKGNQEIDKVSYAHIELYPEVVDQGLQAGKEGSTEMSKIKLLINTKTNRVRSFTYYTKDGNVYTIELKNFKPNTTMTDTEFTFDKKNHPDVEIIDLRDE